MPDLGKYTVEVLSAYGVSLALLVVLLVVTLRHGRAARAALEAAERETKHRG